MTSIQISLIGPPRITINGERIKVPTRKALALLAYLAVTAVPHSRESLIAFFWPELDSGRGRAALRRELSRLNKALATDWVETVGETVQIASTVGVDLHNIREQLHGFQSVTQLQTAVAASAAEIVSAKEFMEGFGLPDAVAFDAWQQQQALSWLQTRQHALFTLSTQLVENGETEEALGAARHLVSLNPFDEASQRLFMTTLAKAGKRTAALQQYDSLTRLLQSELATEPSAETAVLAEEIRASDGGQSATLSEKSQEKPRRYWPWVAGILLVGFLLLVGWNLWRQTNAQIQLAQVRQLIAESEAAPTVSEKLQLTLAANQQLDNFETKAALLGAINQLPHHLLLELTHETAVTAIALHEQSSLLAAGTAEGTITLWDLTTHTPFAAQFLGHNGRMTELLFSADGKVLISAGLDNQVQLWEVETQAKLATLQHQDGHVKTFQIDSTGRWLFTGGSDGRIMVWDIGQSIKNPPLAFPPTIAHSAAVTDLIILKDGTIFSSGWDGHVKTWAFNPNSGLTFVHAAEHPTAFINDLTSWQSDEGTLYGIAAVGRDGVVNWEQKNLQRNEPIFELSHADWVEEILFHSGFYSAGQDGKIIWHPVDLNSDSSSEILAQQNGPIWDLAFDGQTNLLYAAEDSGAVSVWQSMRQLPFAEKIRPYAQQYSLGDNVAKVTFLPDGQLFIGQVDGTLSEINSWAENGQLVDRHHLLDDATAWAIANDGTVALANGRQIQIVFPDGRVDDVLSEQGVVTALAIDTANRQLIIGNSLGNIDVRDLDSLERIQLTTVLKNQSVESITVGSDGDFFIGAIGSQAYLFSKGTIQSQLQMPENITALQINEDSSRLAVGLADGTVQTILLNDDHFGELLDPFIGHSEPVTSLAFSPNGRLLASGSWDSTIQIWEIESGQSIQLIEHERGISTLDFDKNGRYLLSGSWDDSVIIWDLSLETLRSIANTYLEPGIK